jgi:hypothetical protein
MPELPELRAAVRVSAERRFGPRRRRTRRALPVAAVIVAAAAVMVLPRGGTRPNDEIAATATPGTDSGSTGSTFPGWTGSDGDYTIVIESVKSESGAEKIAQKVQDAGMTVGILNSDDFSSLNPGYYVVFSGEYSSMSDAEDALDGIRSEYKDAYVRQIISRADAPVIGEPPGTDTAASTLQALARVYAAFARPARAGDRIRDVPDHLGQTSSGPSTLDLAHARRLATDGPRVLYAIPALQNGHASLCTLLLTNGGAPGSAGCGRFDPEQVNTRPHWSKMFARPAPVCALLLPDGIATVRVHLTTGKVTERRVQDNAVLFQISGLARITWRDATGHEHSTRATI